MKPLLLDTSALLHWLLAPERLGPEARARIENGAARIVVSALSTWEIAIKVGKANLRLPYSVERLTDHCVREHRFELLPIDHAHAAAVEQLPRHHNDPFDRLLVATAHCEGFAIATDDAWIRRYAVEVVW